MTILQGPPRNPVEVRLQERARQRELGYRGVQVLAFVKDNIAEHGTAPSYEMICNQLGISTRAKVCEVVKRLEKRGLLSRVGSGRVRRIRLL